MTTHLRNAFAEAALGLLPSQPEWGDFARFTAWATLSDVHHLKVGSENWSLSLFPGVYLIGKFDGEPTAGPADPFDPAVLYIGRTRTRSLAARWTDLRNALAGRGGHSGGNHIFGDIRSSKTRLGQLRVAALPVWVSKRDAQGRADTSQVHPDRRQISFRTAALEALLIDAVTDANRKAGRDPLVNEITLQA